MKSAIRLAAATPLAAAAQWVAPARPWHYALAVPQGAQRRLALAWLLLAIGALAASGLFSILLVAARAPGLQHLLPHPAFFRIALVVHVDLSVLVWFAAAAGLLWSLAAPARRLGVGWAGFALAFAGSVTMAAAPFVDPGMPIMANYVPVIDSATFLAGLGLFGVGFGLTSLRAVTALWTAWRGAGPLSPADALRFGLAAAAVAATMALAALAWSAASLRSLPPLDARTAYELLFWGPGHVIQFCWTLMMMTAWLWLASLSGARVPLSPRVVVLLFAIGLAAVFATPLIYLAWDLSSVEQRKLFTWQMRFGGGLAIVPATAALAFALARARPPAPPLRACRAALLSSVLLFGTGGLIGFLIQGSDVRIPAHYHGAIVGITLALMGLAYALLPRFGFTQPLPRAAAWQPWVYGGGQLLHIAGLVWSGGYGVQRKVAGAEQVLRTTSEVAGMGLMGLGGLVAVIGGLLFAVVVLRVLLTRRVPA